MPKCPFTNVFYKPTTAMSTHAPTSNATLSSQDTETKATSEGAEPTTHKATVTVAETEEKKIRKGISVLSTEPPTEPKAAKLSEEDGSKFPILNVGDNYRLYRREAWGICRNIS